MESTLNPEALRSRRPLLDEGRASSSRGRRLASLVASSRRDPAHMVFDLRGVPPEHRISQFVNSLLRSYDVVGPYPSSRFLEATWLTAAPCEAELVHRQVALAIRFRAAGSHASGLPAPGTTVDEPAPIDSAPDAEPWPPPEWFM